MVERGPQNVECFGSASIFSLSRMEEQIHCPIDTPLLLHLCPTFNKSITFICSGPPSHFNYPPEGSHTSHRRTSWHMQHFFHSQRDFFHSQSRQCHQKPGVIIRILIPQEALQPSSDGAQLLQQAQINPKNTPATDQPPPLSNRHP